MRLFLRSWAVIVVASVSSQAGYVGSALATSPIRSERGDPYNRPPSLTKPRMICAVGAEADAPRLLCPARLGPPLSLCRCYGARDLGLRYFVFERRNPPTIFSFDGYAY